MPSCRLEGTIPRSTLRWAYQRGTEPGAACGSWGTKTPSGTPLRPSIAEHEGSRDSTRDPTWMDVGPLARFLLTTWNNRTILDDENGEAKVILREIVATGSWCAAGL